MTDDANTGHSAESVEAVLRAQLARADVRISATRPILRHLLADDDKSLFNDEVIARLRGMLSNIARQLLFAQAEAAQIENRSQFADERQDGLVQLLFDDTAFLSHAHALALEGRLSQELQARSGIDCVLTPLLQDLAASDEEQVATWAMRLVASQARFVQQQRRMELPLGELPGELFHRALLVLRSHERGGDAAQAAERQLRAQFDESQGRLGQITRLVMSMGRKAPRALSVDYAGLAIFATALAMASGQDRNLAILSFDDSQLARLALSLRAAGLEQASLEQQFLYFHPDVELPGGFAALGAERAAALLGAAEPGALA